MTKWTYVSEDCAQLPGPQKDSTSFSRNRDGNLSELRISPNMVPLEEHAEGPGEKAEATEDSGRDGPALTPVYPQLLSSS
jgi:hypothetical protein